MLPHCWLPVPTSLKLRLLLIMERTRCLQHVQMQRNCWQRFMPRACLMAFVWAVLTPTAGCCRLLRWPPPATKARMWLLGQWVMPHGMQVTIRTATLLGTKTAAFICETTLHVWQTLYWNAFMKCLSMKETPILINAQRARPTSWEPCCCGKACIVMAVCRL